MRFEPFLGQLNVGELAGRGEFRRAIEEQRHLDMGYLRCYATATSEAADARFDAIVLIVVLIAIVLALALLLGPLLWVLWWLLRRSRAPVPAPEPQPTPTLVAVPDVLVPHVLTGALRTRIAGTPADGSRATAVAADAVIWVDAGDEVLVHLDSLATHFLDRMVLISLDLETDQTGRSTIVVPFALGDENDPAGLFAVTDELPRGDAALVARWGSGVQAAAWAALLALARDHADERASAPRGFTVAGGALRLHAGAPLRAFTA